MELDAAHSSNPISPSNTAIAQGLLDGLLIVGVLLGAVSLCGIRRYGLANLKTKTIVGMVLCGGLLLRSTPGPQLHRNGSHPRFESEVTLGDGEEFRDFVFAIREYKRSPDGTQSLIVATTNKNSRLGFEMVLDATWKSQSLGKVIQVPLVMHEGSAAYRSIGPESDAFVQALDKLYGTQVHPQAMIKELRLHAVSLEGDPSDLSKGPVKLKVYCETGTDEDDAVFYTNIDLQKRKFTMKEKDPEFRSQIVQALQAH